MHGFHGHAPRLPQAGKRMLRTMGFYARAPTAPLAHIRMPQFPARSFCKLRVVRPLRAAPATCAWCDKEEQQHPSFFPMTMPGWTFINVYAHDRYPRDPAIEGLQGGQLGPKTDEDWHTQNEVNTLFFFLFPFSTGFLPGGHVHREHAAPQGLHTLQARRRLCLSLSLP